MALRIKKKRQGYGSGASLAGGASSSWADVPSITPVPVGMVAQINTPQAAVSDSTLEGSNANVDQTFQNKQADYRQQAGEIRRQYGFQDDPNNPYGFGAMDPNNPFSKASLLQKSFQTAQKGYGNSYAARGLAGSGAANAAQKFAANQYQQGYNSLTESLGANLSQLSRGERDLATWREGARNEAFGEFLVRRPDPEPASVSYRPNEWVQRGLKGPNGEQLTVDNRGTWYRDKNTGQVVWVKRNAR